MRHSILDYWEQRNLERIRQEYLEQSYEMMGREQEEEDKMIDVWINGGDEVYPIYEITDDAEEAKNWGFKKTQVSEDLFNKYKRVEAEYQQLQKELAKIRENLDTGHAVIDPLAGTI